MTLLGCKINCSVAHKIIDKGLSVVHSKPSLHVSLAENMSPDDVIRIGDALVIDFQFVLENIG